MFVVNLNTCDQVDEGFEYETFKEAYEGMKRLADTARSYYLKDGIERSVTIYVYEEDSGNENEEMDEG